LSPSQIVLDVGSVKVKPAEALAKVLGEDIPWVGTHPLFGPMSLALAERPLRVVVCPSPSHPSAATRVHALFESMGCQVIEQTPEAHDRVMAHTHALTFFVAKGMLDAGAGMEVPFAPPSFQALARAIETVRSDAGHLFAAIAAENPFAADARKRLVESLASLDHSLGEPKAMPLDIPDLGERSFELKETRELIDALDRDIVALLERRAELARRAGQAKKALGAPVLDASREARVLEARGEWAREHGLDEDAVKGVFQAIMKLSRRIQG
jgi:prephenate dehydrogenase